MSFSTNTTSSAAAAPGGATANAASSSSNRKDMRRIDLVIPYHQPSASSDDSKGDMSSTITTTLPMAAIFTKNKMIGWTSLVYALQNWLSESPDQAARKPGSNPGILGVAMGVMAVFVNYLPLFLPPAPQAKARATAAPGTVPGVQ